MAAFSLFATIQISSGAELSQIFTATRNISERGEVKSCVIIANTNRFSFLLPSGWNLSQIPEENKIVLTSHDLKASVNCRVHFGKFQPEADVLRKQISIRYPDASITAQFTSFAGAQEALGLDLQRTIDTETQLCMRLAFVPFKGGWVELSLASAPDIFPGHCASFNILLSSLQSDPPSVIR